MDTRDLQDLALRLAAFTDALEQRANRMADDMTRSGQTLSQSAQGIAQEIDRLTHHVISTVRSESKNAANEGVKEGIAPGLEQLQQTVRAVQNAGQVLHAQSKALQSSQRSLIWVAGIALSVGAIIAAGGSSYLVWKNQQELQRGEFGRDILQATQSGAITRCGDALCVRVGKALQRYGENGEFVLVK